MVASSFAVIGGIKTHYLRAGDGPAVIFVHGQLPGSCALVDWGENIDALAQAGFRVYAFDQAGFGLTDNPSDLSMATRIAHVKSFIAWTSAARYSLCGSSMGSYIAARIALEDDRVDALVMTPGRLLSPAEPAATAVHLMKLAGIGDFRPSIDNTRKVLNTILYDGDRVSTEFVQLFHDMSDGNNFAASLERARTEPSRDIHEALAGLKVRSLFLWGSDDPLARLDRALQLMKRVPNAELHVLTRCKHWPQFEHAGRANTLIRDFLVSAA